MNYTKSEGVTCTITPPYVSSETENQIRDLSRSRNGMAKAAATLLAGSVLCSLSVAGGCYLLGVSDAGDGMRIAGTLLAVFGSLAAAGAGFASGIAGEMYNNLTRQIDKLRSDTEVSASCASDCDGCGCSADAGKSPKSANNGH